MAMTYVEALETVIPMVEGEVAEKLVALKEQMAKRHTSSKPTKTQLENEKVKEEILSVLLQSEEGMTCGEIVKALEGEYTSLKRKSLASSWLKVKWFWRF